MHNNGIMRLQISLISLVPETARGELASARIEDILSRKVIAPNFAFAIIQTNPAIRFTIFHPQVKYQIHYRPSTDIASPFFFIGNRPLQYTGHTLETAWPQGKTSLFSVINSLEKLLANQTKDKKLPYLPLFPAWCVYRSLG
jgi:hypothetical protein